EIVGEEEIVATGLCLEDILDLLQNAKRQHAADAAPVDRQHLLLPRRFYPLLQQHGFPPGFNGSLVPRTCRPSPDLPAAESLWRRSVAVVSGPRPAQRSSPGHR